MEVPREYHRLFGPSKISEWDSSRARSLGGPESRALTETIDTFGILSARAQGLGHVITSTAKLVSSTHRLYLSSGWGHNGNFIVEGFIKVGKKRLFVNLSSGELKEIEPLCVLDFYVHENMQRSGVGKQLFEYMMASEGKEAEQLAYDRPSPKLMPFLAKHYGLRDFVKQNNNFVVFSKYFYNNPDLIIVRRGRTGAQERESGTGKEMTRGESSSSSVRAQRPTSKELNLMNETGPLQMGFTAPPAFGRRSNRNPRDNLPGGLEDPVAVNYTRVDPVSGVQDRPGPRNSALELRGIPGRRQHFHGPPNRSEFGPYGVESGVQGPQRFLMASPFHQDFFSPPVSQTSPLQGHAHRMHSSTRERDPRPGRFNPAPVVDRVSEISSTMSPIHHYFRGRNPIIG